MTLEQLIAKLEPQLRDAFRAAIADLREGIDYARLRAALERGDIEGAVAALNIEPAAFNQYLAARLDGYSQAGQFWAAALRIPGTEGATVQVRFGMSNPRAEQWIRTQAGDRITNYTQEQVETARRVILDGYSQGQGPQTIATDIAGRINPVTKRREGGIIGLSGGISPVTGELYGQVAYVQSMRVRLESGDPAEMRKVLDGMTLRDKRYDRTIAKAIREGTTLPQSKVDEMVAKYSDRLLARRAEDIARTETAMSVEGSRQENYRQALAKYGLPPEAVTKTWLHNGGIENARMQHIIMNGVSVVGLETPFTLPDGTQMLHTHDPAGGAKHNTNCRCDTRYEIDFAMGVI